MRKEDIPLPDFLKDDAPGGVKVKESTVKKRMVAYANRIPGCHLQARHGGPANRGEPDLTGCFRGLRLEIEVKVGDNRPTPLQYDQMAKWAGVGAVSVCIRSLDELKEILDRLDAVSDGFWWNQAA